MVDISEKDELGRPKYGAEYPYYHEHQWGEGVVVDTNVVRYTCKDLYCYAAWLVDQPAQMKYPPIKVKENEMLIKLHQTTTGGRVWYVSTDDGNYDAIDGDLSKAALRVAEHLEQDVAKTPEDEGLYLLTTEDNFPLVIDNVGDVLDRLETIVDAGGRRENYRMYRLNPFPLRDKK